ncbi:MAG: FecR domain-containing protein [Spirochaetales bacterium]|nr:FecR domain-containing protein [Spirochaetales bacterium]
MRKTIVLGLLLFAAGVCALFYACPQPEQAGSRAESLSDQDLESGKAALTYEEALVVCVSGEVFVKGTADWEYLEIGNIVHPSDNIKVEADSLCELQFGQKAVVRIQDNTEICLKDFWLEPEQTKVDIDLAVGSVLCKVSRLTGTEAFKVHTRTAVCGVRGTEFSVRVTDVKETVLAVKEGEVAIVPESAEAEKIEKQTQLDNTKLKELVGKMEDTALVVKARQEVIVNQEAAEEADRMVKGMVEEIKKADRDKELSDAELDTLSDLVTETAGKIKKSINQPREISAEREDELKDLDKMEIKEVRAGVEKPDGEKDDIRLIKIVPVLIKIKITAEPKDADIYLDGMAVGKGRFQKLYEEGKTIRFTVRKPGFTDKSITVETGKDTQKEYAIVLKELAGGEKVQEKKDTKKQAETGEDPNKTAALTDKPAEEKKPETAPAEEKEVSTTKTEENPQLKASFDLLLKYGGHTYYISKQSATWSEAKKICEQNGGHLVTVTSAEENQAIINALKSHKIEDNVWIGYTDKGHEGSWTWVTGEKSEFQYWHFRQPDNWRDLEHYAFFLIMVDDNMTQKYRWNDCMDMPFSFMLEIE